MAVTEQETTSPVCRYCGSKTDLTSSYKTSLVFRCPKCGSSVTVPPV